MAPLRRKKNGLNIFVKEKKGRKRRFVPREVRKRILMTKRFLLLFHSKTFLYISLTLPHSHTYTLFHSLSLVSLSPSLTLSLSLSPFKSLTYSLSISFYHTYTPISLSLYIYDTHILSFHLILSYFTQAKFQPISVNMGFEGF